MKGGEGLREGSSPPSQDNIQSGIQWSLETGDICLASNVSGSTQLQGTGTLHGTLPQCYNSLYCTLLKLSGSRVRTGITYLITRTCSLLTIKCSGVGHLAQFPPNCHARQPGNNKRTPLFYCLPSRTKITPVYSIMSGTPSFALAKPPDGLYI